MPAIGYIAVSRKFLKIPLRCLTSEGMAVSLVYDLGVHLDALTYVQSGEITQIMAQQRYRAFWATLILDRYISIFHRPALWFCKA